MKEKKKKEREKKRARLLNPQLPVHGAFALPLGHNHCPIFTRTCHSNFLGVSAIRKLQRIDQRVYKLCWLTWVSTGEKSSRPIPEHSLGSPSGIQCCWNSGCSVKVKQSGDQSSAIILILSLLVRSNLNISIKLINTWWADGNGRLRDCCFNSCAPLNFCPDTWTLAKGTRTDDRHCTMTNVLPSKKKFL